MRELYEGIINNLDSMWLGMSAGFFNAFGDAFGNDIESIGDIAGQWQDINWKRQTVSLGDLDGANTWRFKLDKSNHLMLYKGVSCCWYPDHHHARWIDLEVKLKTRIDNEVNQILLEE